MAFLAQIARRFAACALIAAAACGSSAFASPLRPGLGPTIQAYLDPLLRTNNFSGVVLIAKGDSVVFQKAYGYADIEQQVPNTPQTLFHVASVSKPFTAAAIMLLAERGKLDIHAPLRKIIPDYPNGDTLTIHHLLTHTSGIPNINDLPEYGDIQLKPHSPEQLVAYFRNKPLDREPGSEFSYSNSNYNLLAYIIEKASGEAYGTFLKKQIFDRLGMPKTRHPSSVAEIVPGLAEGYAPEGNLGLQRAPYLDWSVKTGNGSLYTSPADLLRFFRGVHTRKLLDAKSQVASFTQHVPNVGYGWFLTKANGRELHHINGRSPGWAAQADYYVKDEVTILVLSNFYISVTTPIARAVGAIYFGEPFEKMPNLSAEKLPPKSVQPLLGTYQFGADYYVPNAALTIASKDGNVQAEYANGYPPSPFIPITATTFLIRPFWSSAEFLLGADGKASELRIDGIRGVRTAKPATAQ